MVEELLSVKEVARLLAISEDSVYRIVRQENGLQGVRIGRCIRFRPSDVESYIKSREIASAKRQEPFPGMRRFHYIPGMKVVSL